MVGWGGPVRECPEGQTAYIGFARDQICNNDGSPRRVLAKKKKKSKSTMALIPEKALPSASFCRQRYSRNQPDCLLPSSPSRLPLGCSRYITAGGYWLSKAMAAPSSVPFPLKQKLFSLATVHHIYNSLLIKARSTFKAERKPCSPSLCELVFQQKALVLQSQFFCVRHCALTWDSCLLVVFLCV